MASSKAFPPANRLKIKAEFDHVFSRPNQRSAQGVLQAIYKERGENRGEPREDRAPQPPRLGLVIAKRYLPLAVQRNRVKRLIREQFRLAQDDLPPVDIIVRLTRRPEVEVSAGDVAALFGKMQRAENTAS